ncbi:hypothetical protein ADUPG1_000249 [Aduncisulcus paluster]|uniref:Uncharacterized protein n=1 Tax=Aduncisulcus paluster TaxID=2918883 RepID=A0ABQ5K5N3_9EUKA|nr:hypothetical protein ADUPG1_000249 [Aduncisulcus paluster]
MELHEMCEWYGTVQNFDTDLDERLNGFITPRTTALSKNNLVPLGIRIQNDLRDLDISIFKQIGPRDPEWMPVANVWCAISDGETGFNYVKLVNVMDIPNPRRIQCEDEMKSHCTEYPTHNFYFVRYYCIEKIDDITKDVVLKVWGEENGDSYGVEVQGGMICEVRVCGNVLLRYHPLNKDVF